MSHHNFLAFTRMLLVFFIGFLEKPVWGQEPCGFCVVSKISFFQIPGEKLLSLCFHKDKTPVCCEAISKFISNLKAIKQGLHVKLMNNPRMKPNLVVYIFVLVSTDYIYVKEDFLMNWHVFFHGLNVFLSVSVLWRLYFFVNLVFWVFSV